MVVPTTVPFRAVVCPPMSVVEVGATVTAMVGTNATVRVALLVGSTELVAVRVMFCEVERFSGTV